jgi:hypothetical protein
MVSKRQSLCLLALLSLVGATSEAAIVQRAAMINGIGTAKFTVEGGATVTRTSKTVPYFTNSFQYGGRTYPYTMVGADPSTALSTTVPTAIIPINFVFSAYGNYPLDGTTKVQRTIDSPIFSNYGFTSAAQPTQWGDAVQRATFWSSVGASNAWHVNLGTPTVYPTQTISVPKNQAQLYAFDGNDQDGNPIVVVFATMNASWFGPQLHNLINQLHISPTVVPIVATYNTFLYQKDSCCILGYHGAFSSLNGNGNQQIQTFIFASYSDPGIFGDIDNNGNFIPVPIEDVHALSHEVSEWMNDPFVNNAVPPWQSPFGAQYGCSGTLETGDPLVGFAHPMADPNHPGRVYNPQNQALLQWFSRVSPSDAIGGVYTYPDDMSLVGFPVPSSPCGGP